MKIKNTIHFAVQLLARAFPCAARRNFSPAPPPVPLAFDLDQITESGLRLREALPVLSAEYWLKLGEPDLALQELQTLPEPMRQHHWPWRVRFAANLQLALRNPSTRRVAGDGFMPVQLIWRPRLRRLRVSCVCLGWFPVSFPACEFFSSVTSLGRPGATPLETSCPDCG